ncbi:MAG: TetR-like C-terminal domain-containing protein [Sphingomicrobium sp.]
MIIDAFITKAAFDVTPKLSGSFAKDLRSVLTKLFEILETPLGPALIATAAELRARSGSDYSRAYFDRRMAQLDPMFDAAVDRGELPKEVDREALFTFAAGSIYFRMFIAARGVDGKFITTIVDHVRRIYGAGA